MVEYGTFILAEIGKKRNIDHFPLFSLFGVVYNIILYNVILTLTEREKDMTSKIHFNIGNKIGSLESTLKSQRELLEVNPNLAFTEFTKDVLATYPEKIRKLKKFADLKNFWTFTPTAKDFEDFVNLLIKNKINFHPEDDFNDYTNQDGSKTFPNEHTAIIVNDNFDIARQTLSEKVFWKICFDALKKGMNSPQQELEELQAKAWKQRYPNGFKSDK